MIAGSGLHARPLPAMRQRGTGSSTPSGWAKPIESQRPALAPVPPAQPDILTAPTSGAAPQANPPSTVRPGHALISELHCQQPFFPTPMKFSYIALVLPLLTACVSIDLPGVVSDTAKVAKDTYRSVSG